MAWDRGGDAVVPGPAELATAERALNQMARYPVVAARVVGDFAPWMTEQRRRLALAKELGSLEIADVGALAAAARRGSAHAIRRLARALVVEALCLDALAVAPSRVLVARGRRAVAPLVAVATDDALPRRARALAALALGAIERAALVRVGEPMPDADTRRARAYGRFYGLPSEPALAAALLVEPNGEALVRRCEAALGASSPFAFPVAWLRELLVRGVEGERVVALTEAAAEAAPLAALLLDYRSDLPDPASQQCRVSIAERLAESRRRTLEEAVAIYHRYAREGEDPAPIRVLTACLSILLAVIPHASSVANQLLPAFRAGLKLPVDLRLAYLEILHDRRERLWRWDWLPQGERIETSPGRIAAWLDQCWLKSVRPVARLLGSSRSAAIVHDALDLDLHLPASGFEWKDRALYAVLLEILRDADESSRLTYALAICRALDKVETADAARSIFLPLLAALRRAPQESRWRIFYVVANTAPRSRRRGWSGIATALAIVDDLLWLAERSQDNGLLQAAVSAARVFERLAPERRDAWLRPLLEDLVALHGENEDVCLSVAGSATSLALSMADGRVERFRHVARTLVRDATWTTRHGIDAAAASLGGRSELFRILGDAFVDRQARTLALVLRIGQAVRLGRGALAPLDALEAGADETAPADAGWAALLAVAPGLEPDVRSYVRAARLVGRDRALPAGVARVLRLPERLARELEYLEGLVVREPENANVAARAASLRARLADRERLEAFVREDAVARFSRVARETRLEAVERQTVACYRARLLEVAGAVPDDLTLDENALNAIQIGAEIFENRSLLNALLRAWVHGDRTWRERQPANAAFLEGLRARGVDVAAWLGAHPRVHSCEGAHGGAVRLALEPDPLAVLQMGNYFDTCLSVGGCNVFSTVANACELNKRVVFARDGAGRVVGRQLIAVAESGGLVGFSVYASLQDPKANSALRRAFAAYVEEFATLCRLERVDEGVVPILFAEDWYDDGVEAWQQPEQGGASVRSRSNLR